MISGVILAGGKNTRMAGRDKAFIKINGKAIVLRILDIFQDIFEEVWIITNTPERYWFLKRKKVFFARDIIKDKGPLAGIYTGLKHMKAEAGFFAACDMPDLNAALIEKQVLAFQKGKYECLVPMWGRNYLEPLHAVYAKSLARRIYSFLQGSSRARSSAGVRGFLKTCNCGFLKASKKETGSFLNINTIE